VEIERSEHPFGSGADEVDAAGTSVVEADLHEV
jgi:hypothetical protein